MTIYVLEGQDFVKIGISKDIKNRLSSYENIKRVKVFNDLDEDVARFIELSIIEEFSSDTEFMYGVKFEDVVHLVESKKYQTVVDFFFKPLGLNLRLNEDGYYELTNAIKYINNIRVSKGKKEIFPADYSKNKTVKEFLNILKSKTNKVPFLSKVGKYGGTYAIPYAVIDFLIWSDVSVKVDVLNWMYYDKKDYQNFANTQCGINKCKAQL